jgi:hypothetical protein
MRSKIQITTGNVFLHSYQICVRMYVYIWKYVSTMVYLRTYVCPMYVRLYVCMIYARMYVCAVRLCVCWIGLRTSAAGMCMRYAHNLLATERVSSAAGKKRKL